MDGDEEQEKENQTIPKEAEHKHKVTQVMKEWTAIQNYSLYKKEEYKLFCDEKSSKK